MYIVHYKGEGVGFMSGKTEYILLFRNRPTDEQLEPATGFVMLGKAQYELFCGDDSLFPTEEVMAMTLCSRQKR